ncbi:uncharacterized protein LOC116336654 isoform X2 [Contarinia nasturtii]|uniref:uncharacterized protein LOC116336654 isoform X2 n=1 Tax=Contarinia nasturtii TaxID=265458 RepID=UPI0012D4B7D7|nr:uncharacterized protein LOC116336654 isoform X2 [Contarinia nasturtii]
MENLVLKWRRPETIEFPKVWHTFKVRDMDTDKLVEYRIQDLPSDRTEEILEHLVANFIQDAPVLQAFEGAKDPNLIEDYKLMWRKMIDQNVSLVCFKEDSNEIVGANVLFVIKKDDEDFMQMCCRNHKSQITKDVSDLILIVEKNFDVFNHYGINEYLTSYGLCVDRKFRGRNIGVHFLETRKKLCKEYGLKLTHSTFSSTFSSKIADNVGFETNFAMKKYFFFVLDLKIS